MDKTESVVAVTESMEKNEKDVPKKEPNYRGIVAMPFVIGNETFEKLGTIGTSTNLLVYLTSVFHMKSIAATNLVNVFNGTCNFGGLIGAYLCDTYFGRYKTIGFASVSSFFGMLALALTAAVPTLHPPKCEKKDSTICKSASAGQMAFLISGFIFLIVGASGIRPCNLAFGADQFNPNTESGRKGTNSFFNWYYFTYTFAVMVSSTIIVYVQTDVSWSIGLAIPTILMLLSCVLFFAGTKIYVKVLPEGSPMTSVAQVIAVSIKKRGLKLPEQHFTLFNHIPADTINLKLPHTDQFRFLDKAAILTPEDQIKSDGSAANPWNLCSMQQIEEVKCLLRMVPIWIAGIIFEISGVQLQNFVVFQALQSNRQLFSTSFKIPAGTYVVFSMVALSIWLPIYDRIVVPVLRRYTKKEDGITLLQRMGIGIVLTISALFVAGIVETRRRTVALTRPTLGFAEEKGSISSLSAMWFIPQLALFGLAQGFTFIGENELFYKQSPENMRSIAASLVLCGVAFSNYLSSFITEIVQKATTKGASGNWLAQDLNKAKLDNFYYVVGALEILNLGYFLLCAKWFRYKGTGDLTLELAAMEKVQPEKPAEV
uniref:NRT1/PTR family protein 2.6 n=1 Tax=Mitragyna speciosa TaxID=170351 RepID=A0AAT9URG3_9GENT